MTIQAMDLMIKLHAGKKNGNADALSRIPEECSEKMNSTVLNVTAQDGTSSDTQSLSQELQEQLEDIQQQQQRRDLELLLLINYLHIGELPDKEKAAKKIVLESAKYDPMNAVLYSEYPTAPHHWCIVVPKELQELLLEEIHEGSSLVTLLSGRPMIVFNVTTGGGECTLTYIGTVVAVCLL